VLAEAGDSIKHFYNTGVLELGDPLGPVLWQFAPTKKFDEADFASSWELLRARWTGASCGMVVEVRHPSFRVPAFHCAVEDVRDARGVRPSTAPIRRSPMSSGRFVYARLQKGK